VMAQPAKSPETAPSGENLGQSLHPKESPEADLTPSASGSNSEMPASTTAKPASRPGYERTRVRIPLIATIMAALVFFGPSVWAWLTSLSGTMLLSLSSMGAFVAIVMIPSAISHFSHAAAQPAKQVQMAA